MTEWNSTFCKNMFSLCFSDILNRVTGTKTDIQLLQFVTVFNEIFIPKPHCHKFNFLQISKLSLKLHSVCPNIEWLLAHKWVKIWFSKASKDPPFSFHISKIAKALKETDFWLFKVQNGLKAKHIFLGLFETNRSVAAKP